MLAEIYGTDPSTLSPPNSFPHCKHRINILPLFIRSHTFLSSLLLLNMNEHILIPQIWEVSPNDCVLFVTIANLFGLFMGNV